MSQRSRINAPIGNSNGKNNGPITIIATIKAERPKELAKIFHKDSVGSRN